MFMAVLKTNNLRNTYDEKIKKYTDVAFEMKNR